MKTLKNVGKRVVALVLALMMCVGMLATTAFAEDVPEVQDQIEANGPDCGIGKHQYAEVIIKAATCTENGEKENRCTKCGKKEPGSGRLILAHHTESGKYKIESEPTCILVGGKYKICSVCEKPFGVLEIIPTIDHQLDTANNNIQWEIADNNHTGPCSMCHLPAIVQAHYVATPATCQTEAKCICGKVMGPVDPDNHSFTNYESNNNASCTANGTETAKCDYCDATDTREIANSKLPHVYEGATCQNKGVCKCGAEGETNPNVHSGEAKTEWNDSEHWQIYANCNHEIADTRFAHDFTWAKDGDTYTGTCRCGYVKTGVLVPEHVCVFDGDWVVGNGYHWHNCTVYPGDCPGVKDKNQHSTTQGWVDNSDGTHKKVCDVCGATYETADHNWNAWVKVEDGYQRTCADCGAVDTDTSKVTVNDGHDHTAYAVDVAAVAATCTETGLTAGVKCDLCGKWIDEPTVTNALNHDFGDWYTVTAAQVGVAGLERHDCKREGCGASETRRIDPLPDTGTGDVVIDDTNPPLGGDPDGGDGEVELDDIGVPLAGPVTRGEFVDYLYRREGSPEAALSTFVDVPADHEYASAIGWGQVNDIAWGINETEFAPDELVTVEQVKLFLSRYAAFKGIEMPELAALVGLDDQDYAMNCDEILGEFFGADE